MMHTNTDEKRRNYSHLLLWSKVVFAVCFFLCQGFQAQITLSGSATIYLEQNTTISGITNISNSEDGVSLASGAIIYHSDSGKNKQVIPQKPSKIKEESALKIAKIQKEKKQKEKIASMKIPVQEKKKFFSTQKSDESFTADESFSTIIIQTPTYQLKDFIQEKLESSLVLSWENGSEINSYFIVNQKKKTQVSFFTRPPPFYI